MKNCTRHSGTLKVIERLGSSVNGNPRFKISIDGYIAVTTPDSSLGYSVQNYDGKHCEVILGTHYGKLSVESIHAK